MNIVFIGGGNMASSLIGGLIADGFNARHISVVELNAEKRQLIAQRFAVHVTDSLNTVIEYADVVTFCIKPQQFKEVATASADAIQARNPLVISIAAGIRTADIAYWLGGSFAIVRAMPNTPALVQTGASALFANDNVSEEQRNHAESLLRAVGIVEWVGDETLMDVVTALSGSGPAYFFRIMEGLVKASEQLGLSKDAAHLLTIQTALGAAKMALESEEDIATLREQVTSPGGTTEQGLKIMNDNNIDQLLLDVLKAAQQRAVELADQLGEG
jgi:pyrroline-5-carboxylate reductase